MAEDVGAAIYHRPQGLECRNRKSPNPPPLLTFYLFPTFLPSALPSHPNAVRREPNTECRPRPPSEFRIPTSTFKSPYTLNPTPFTLNL